MDQQDLGQQGFDHTSVNDTLHKVDSSRVEQDGDALRRRSYYIYVVTGVAFGLIAAVLVCKPEESIGKTILEGCFSLLEVLIISYLGANVIDRTRLVDKVTRMSDPPPLPPYPYQGGPPQPLT